MAHGVGTLTFDEEHELMRQRILRYQYQAGSNSALAHFYSGIKARDTSFILDNFFIFFFLMK